MSENNEFHGNPESGVDRLLNESAQTDELKEAYRMRDSYRAQVVNLEEQLEKAEKLLNQIRDQIQSDLEGHVEPSSYIEECGSIMEILGIEPERDVTIELEFQYSMTIRLPYSVDVSELDADDFAPNDPDSYEYEVQRVECTSSDIRERSRW